MTTLTRKLVPCILMVIALPAAAQEKLTHAEKSAICGQVGAEAAPKIRAYRSAQADAAALAKRVKAELTRIIENLRGDPRTLAALRAFATPQGAGEGVAAEDGVHRAIEKNKVPGAPVAGLLRSSHGLTTGNVGADSPFVHWKGEIELQFSSRNQPGFEHDTDISSGENFRFTLTGNPDADLAALDEQLEPTVSWLATRRASGWAYPRLEPVGPDANRYVIPQSPEDFAMDQKPDSYWDCLYDARMMEVLAGAMGTTLPKAGTRWSEAATRRTKQLIEAHGAVIAREAAGIAAEEAGPKPELSAPLAVPAF